MNDLIKMSIDSRKNSFYTLYEINDEETNNKINELFKKIEEFGITCDDIGDFEEKFATSKLNSEYINLFTTIAQSHKAKEIVQEPNEVKSDEEYIKEEIESDIRYVVESATMPARHKARETFDSKMRDTPIVGDLMQASQTMDLFKKYCKKDDNE